METGGTLQAGGESLREKVECDLVLKVRKVGSLEKSTFQAQGPAQTEGQARKTQKLSLRTKAVQLRQQEWVAAHRGSTRNELGERCGAGPAGQWEACCLAGGSLNSFGD